MSTLVPLIVAGLSLVFLVFAADARAVDVRMAYVHAAIAAATALLVAGIAVRQCRTLLAKAASASEIASVAIPSGGYVAAFRRNGSACSKLQ